MITWTSVGLMGAAATIAGQNLGAGHPERAIQGVHTAVTHRSDRRHLVGLMFVVFPHALLGVFGAHRGAVATHREQLLRFLAVSGLFITVALVLHRRAAGHRRYAQPAVHLARVADRGSASGCARSSRLLRPLQPTDIWLAIVLGHFTRCVLRVLRFRQGKWRSIRVAMA